MATTNSALAVKTRAKTGTTAATAVRRAGGVPGTLYGHGNAPLSIELDARAFDELLHGGGKNQLLEITLDDGAKDTALIRDVQRDPISRRVIHADLQRVSATEEISASLPIVFVGTPEGVRNSGGVMDVIVRTLGVIGPANALPESIEAVVDHLEIHEHLSAGELSLPEGITLDMDPGTVLVAVEPSRTEVEAEAAPAVAEGAEVPTVAESESGSGTESA
jgi:large subunit ribosomal protein L25